jgi:N-acyl-D-amino-acid deacylase
MLDWLLAAGEVVDGTGAPAETANVSIVGDRIAYVGRDTAPQAVRTLDVRQGVTTEVVGNCGQTYAPLTDRNRDAMRERSKGWQPSVEITWSGVGEYLDEVRRANGVNGYFLVGQGTLCHAVVGTDESTCCSNRFLDEGEGLDRVTVNGRLFDSVCTFGTNN